MASLTTPQTYNKLDLLRLMFLSREGDRREAVLLRQSKGWFQVPGMGHEALAAVAYHLRDDDFIFPHYRDRGLMLARGMTNMDLAYAFFAKRDSNSGGRQMPAHYSFRQRNVWSVPTPTGGNLLPAVGAAWGMKLRGTDSVVVASFGDAASRQGEVYEAISFAVQERLPVVFMMEDNQYGISTNTERMNPYKIGVLGERDLVRVNARHPDNVYEAARAAVEKARSGGGPTILWCELDRLSSHTSSDDHRVYRTEDDIKEMMSRDPIVQLVQELIKAGELTEQDWEAIQDEIRDQVDREYIEAENSEDPRGDEVMDHLYGELPKATPPPLEGGRKWRMVDALNQVFKVALSEDRNYVFFGEDIEDPKGGVFKLTDGLSTLHPDRVFNSPLAEATILGVACGLACYGMKPVFELQFIDFVGPAWSQLVNNLATIRWRSNGTWTCPAIIYAPYGAYLPGGSIWHSQANEGAIAHFPGLRIMIPSNPQDAAAMMWTALKADDPTVFLIPKHLFRMNVDVSEDIEPVGFGEAKVVREGSDVTIVTWGNCIEQATEAADELEGEVSCEIIDLRSIVPLDYETIKRSIEKTGRLIVIQEDTRTCSIGQAIIQELTSNSDTWGHFISPPQLVSKSDVYIGFNPIYEYAALPDTKRVVEAIRLVMED
ncbi:2-oxoisovalerate dehydrogenase [Fimbriimonadia bacterium ATM]|nr:MAG: 2-oxoisovalerate dehydrogenase [Armatimonadota bacterium]MBC6969573.1 2-oxoisovalerate dehydrogenase [Armatimonadota bacterium]MCE7898842.1 2-oxoisovalerate dehydrogenase [Armatimonadetes bacterium ATM1]MDL1928906.1 2-oxoisovalerate dehydrogenase [Fimbriimonadia bacterium ATM]RIJ97829.1 MAG: 2-oxoisovalerate dehydrogenase [Armatimonadota bacterium]